MMIPYRMGPVFQQPLLGTMDNYNPYSSSSTYNISNESMSKLESFDYSHLNNNNHWATYNLLSNSSLTSSDLIPSTTSTSNTTSTDQRPHQIIRTPSPCTAEKLNNTHLSQINTANISALHHHTHLHQHLYPPNAHRSSINELELNPNWNGLNGGEYHHMTTPSFRQYPAPSCSYPNNIYGEHQHPPIKFEIEYDPRLTTSASYPHPTADQFHLPPQGLQNICKNEQLLTTNLDSSNGDVYTNVLCIPPQQSLPPRRQQKQQFEWLKSHNPTKQHAPNGKTRTRDKYRVVYSEHQRFELENEFVIAKYITIPRKTTLAQALSLSERQIKIWFQNRRAKERKVNKKRSEVSSNCVNNENPHVNNSSNDESQNDSCESFCQNGYS